MDLLVGAVAAEVLLLPMKNLSLLILPSLKGLMMF